MNRDGIYIIYYNILYCIVLYCIVLYCIVLYCIVLYCIVLYCIIAYVGRYSNIYYLRRERRKNLQVHRAVWSAVGMV